MQCLWGFYHIHACMASCIIKDCLYYTHIVQFILPCWWCVPEAKTSKMLKGFLLLLVVFFQGIKDFKKGVATADTEVSDSSNQSFQDNELYNTTIPSIFSLLFNRTSNTVVNITNNTALSSFVVLKDLENITIFGHLNTTINCNSTGGVKFVSCKNITI